MKDISPPDTYSKYGILSSTGGVYLKDSPIKDYERPLFIMRMNYTEQLDDPTVNIPALAIFGYGSLQFLEEEVAERLIDERHLNDSAARRASRRIVLGGLCFGNFQEDRDRYHIPEDAQRYARLKKGERVYWLENGEITVLSSRMLTSGAWAWSSFDDILRVIENENCRKYGEGSLPIKTSPSIDEIVSALINH
jgi:hypothetical protein